MNENLTMAERKARAAAVWRARLVDFLTLIIVLGLAVFVQAIMNAFAPTSPTQQLGRVCLLLTVYAVAGVIGLERRERDGEP